MTEQQLQAIEQVLRNATPTVPYRVWENAPGDWRCEANAVQMVTPQVLQNIANNNGVAVHTNRAVFS